MTIVECNNHACDYCVTGVCAKNEIALCCEYQHEFTCADNTVGE